MMVMEGNAPRAWDVDVERRLPAVRAEVLAQG
jgi:hypothetical protein